MSSFNSIMNTTDWSVNLNSWHVHLQYGTALQQYMCMGSNQSPKAIFTYKCISAVIYHPVVYRAHKGRRQLPSENIQLHISNTRLKHTVCVTSRVSGWNWVISWKTEQWYFYVGICHLITWQELECLNATVFTWMDVIALEVCACTSVGVISGCVLVMWVSTLSVFDSHTADTLSPDFCFASLCHKLTYLGKVVTNRLPVTLAERV